MKKIYKSRNCRELNDALDFFIFIESILDITNEVLTLPEARMCIKEIYEILLSCGYNVKPGEDYASRKAGNTKALIKKIDKIKETLTNFEYNIN